MSLEVIISFYLGDIVKQDVIHGYEVGTQMLGPFYNVDIEVPWRILHDKTAVGIDVDRIDVGTGQQTVKVELMGIVESRLSNDNYNYPVTTIRNAH